MTQTVRAEERPIERFRLEWEAPEESDERVIARGPWLAAGLDVSYGGQVAQSQYTRDPARE